MPMPKLVSIAVERSEAYMAVDAEGHVWKGQLKTHRGGGNYVEWTPLGSEFPREHGQ